MYNVTGIRNILGECPVWSPEEERLYWMDLLEPALYFYYPAYGCIGRWEMPEYLGGLVLRERGGLIIGLQTRIVCFDPYSGKFEDLVVLGDQGDGIRFNDAKCDRKGRMFIGNMKDPSISKSENAEQEKCGAGNIYLLDADLEFKKLESGFTTPNGFVWSRDDSALFVADSDLKTIFTYDYVIERADIDNKKTFIKMTEEKGVPDGACMDEEGCIWSARHQGGRVVRFSPEGKEIQSISLPVSKPTSVAFGGKNLETLYITTCAQDLTPEELAKEPLAGMLLALDVGVRGIQEPLFAG